MEERELSWSLDVGLGDEYSLHTSLRELLIMPLGFCEERSDSVKRLLSSTSANGRSYTTVDRLRELHDGQYQGKSLLAYISNSGVFIDRQDIWHHLSHSSHANAL